MPNEPLHARITEQLLGQINSGQYPVGSVLPSELDLAALLGVSRHTLRIALSQLESQARIHRKKNVGTTIMPLPSASYVQSLGTVDELVQWARACQRHVQSSASLVISKNLAQKLGCESGSHWLQIQSLRYQDALKSPPVAHTTAYIDERYAAVLPQIRKQSSILMVDLLQQHFGLNLSVIEQEVQAIELLPELAQTLKAQEEKLAMQVLRRYLNSSGNPVLITVSIHPASRFVLSTRMERKVSIH